MIAPRVFWAALLLIGFVIAEDDPFREKDVVYFEGIEGGIKQVELAQITDVFTDRQFATHIATLPQNYKVKVLGYHPKGWLITTEYKRNTVEGWIAPARIPAPDPDLLKKAKEAAQRGKELESAIKSKRVIAGMNMEEVRQALGKPSKVSFRHDANGKKDVWNYVSYKSVPQVRVTRDINGNLVQITDWIKVPMGETLIEFSEEKVIAVEETRDLRQN